MEFWVRTAHRHRRRSDQRDCERPAGGSRRDGSIDVLVFGFVGLRFR